METLLANHEKRTVKGLLMPWGEKSRASNIGPIMFSRDVLTIPADPSVVTANRDHKREDPVGRAIALDDTDAGLVATFSIANTPEGDELLAAVDNGKYTRLSAEVKGIVRDAVDKTRAVSGALFGAAFVDEGAFKSATLYAELAKSETSEKYEYTDDDGVTWRRVIESERTTEYTDTGSTTTTTTTETTEVDEEEQQQEETEVETETLDAAKGNEAASVPQTLLAAKSEKINKTSLYDVANAMAGYFKNGDTTAIEAIADEDRSAGELMYAALTDIKATSAGAPGLAIIQPQWIGDVWAARTRPRKFSQLIGQAVLTSYKVSGFKFTQKPAGGDWPGNKSAVPGTGVTTEPVSVQADRWAGGHDIAREYVDFDVPEFWVSYFQYMTNDYIAWDDKKTLGYLIAGATAIEHGDLPANVTPAMGMLVDGSLAVVATEEATPTFAIAGIDRFRELLLQTKDNILPLLSMSLGLEEGAMEEFRILPSADPALAGKVLVGAKDAATHYELGGAPIRTNALDLAKGGVDHAMFGYSTTLIRNADALVIVSAPAGV